MATASRIAGAALLIALGTLPACKSGEAGARVGALPAEEVVVGCVKQLACGGGLASYDFCGALYEAAFSAASDAQRREMNAYSTCLFEATDCAAVQSCARSACTLGTPARCEGNALVTCWNGAEVRTECGSPGSSGNRCLTDGGGRATCAIRDCDQEEIATGAWCDGDRLYECSGGLLQLTECRTRPGTPRCGEEGISANCVRDLTDPCDPATFTPTCEGSAALSCHPSFRLVAREDCSAWPLRTQCTSDASGVDCVSPGTPCTPGAAPCDNDTIVFCSGGREQRYDCRNLGMVCVPGVGAFAQCAPP